MTPPRPVVFVVFDGLQPLDLVGPYEVFAGANTYEQANGRPAPYQLSLAASRSGTVRSRSGLGIVVAHPLPAGDVDTIVVVGGDGSRTARHDPVLINWLRIAATRARRTCSVCTGAFVLAAAGLLDGRTATTHWAAARELQADHPALTVDAEPLFHRQDGVWTSAGVTAGIDLALALVEADLGVAAAQTVARHLVLFQRRSGGQSQFAGEVWTDPPERDALRAVLGHLHQHPDGDLRLPTLAAHAGLSVRHLQRLFAAEVGEPVSEYVTRVRVEAARRLLEQEPGTVAEVARRCGFGSAESMRRAFQRRLGIPPDAYRDRFRPVLTRGTP